MEELDRTMELLEKMSEIISNINDDLRRKENYLLEQIDREERALKGGSNVCN